MKKTLLFGMIFLVAFLARATDLRGRVEGMHGYATSPFPMPSARITLFSTNPDGSYKDKPAATTISGTDGMYYFKNISPGKYILQVDASNYPLDVLDTTTTQDIQPVLLHF